MFDINNGHEHMRATLFACYIQNFDMSVFDTFYALLPFIMARSWDQSKFDINGNSNYLTSISNFEIMWFHCMFLMQDHS